MYRRESVQKCVGRKVDKSIYIYIYMFIRYRENLNGVCGGKGCGGGERGERERQGRRAKGGKGQIPNPPRSVGRNLKEGGKGQEEGGRGTSQIPPHSHNPIPLPTCPQPPPARDMCVVGR